ncbi:RNA polymerase sigma factor [Streptomyces sp. NPDC015346]|uniref:RNA polymerase sigma factor n=1 Tax=Streptomyces sp. NPDC015346 TaxID=3364954 RepID=UPI0036FD03A1
MTTDMHPAHSTGPGDRAAHLRWQRMWSHREQLLKVARRRSMSAEDAEDAVQEAMLRGAQNAHLDEARLGAWLTTVTMRLCVDRHRQVRREAEVGSTPKLMAPGPVPVEEIVCDRAEASWVAYRSRELPARQAEALRLKSEDRDVEQIAREMGLSSRAVESLLARARRTLRNSLAGTLALALWLIGRGRDQAGHAGHAGVPVQALAATSAAAALAVVGLLAPFAYDRDAPRPGRPGTSEAVGEEKAGFVAPSPAPSPSSVPPSPSSPSSPSSASPASSPRPDAKASPTVLPPVPVPTLVPVRIAVPTQAPAAVPDVPGVPLPEVPGPLPSRLPAPPATPAVPPASPPPLPADLPHLPVHP